MSQAAAELLRAPLVGAPAPLALSEWARSHFLLHALGTLLGGFISDTHTKTERTAALQVFLFPLRRSSDDTLWEAFPTTATPSVPGTGPRTPAEHRHSSSARQKSASDAWVRNEGWGRFESLISEILFVFSVNLRIS